jgi:hypothetical protein
LLTVASELLTQAEAAVHGGMLHLGLALQHSNDLRYDWKELPYDFIHVLGAQLSLRLAVRRVADSRERSLRLREDLRQCRYQLANHLIHVLL